MTACAEPPPAADSHLDTVAREHAGHSPGANASFQEPQQPVLGDKISYRIGNGGLVHGYLARPTNIGIIRSFRPSSCSTIGGA